MTLSRYGALEIVGIIILLLIIITAYPVAYYCATKASQWHPIKTTKNNVFLLEISKKIMIIC